MQKSAVSRCAILSVRSTGRHRAVKRREFITLLGGAAAWPLAARAQQQPVHPLIGVLSPLSAVSAARNIAGLRSGLRDLGYLEGRNVTLALRCGDGAPIAMVARLRLPTMYGFREFADAGGLMSYGYNLPDAYRQMARLVVKILKGDRPGELPFELPARYELIVNLKTAKAIGLMIPDSFVLLADEVIE